MPVPLRKLLFVVLETLLLYAVVVPSAHLRTVLTIVRGDLPADLFDWRQALVRATLIVLPCQLIFFLNDLYDWRVVKNRQQCSIRLLESCSLAFLLSALLYFALDGIDRFVLDLPPGASRFGVYKTALAPAIVVTCLVYVTAQSYRRLWSYALQRLPIHDRVLVIGDGPMAQTIERELGAREEPGYRIVGYVLPEGGEKAQATIRGHPVLGSYGDIQEVVRREGIDRVVVCLAERRGNLPVMELLACRLQGVRVEEGELLYERITGKIAVDRLRPSYLIFSEGFHRSRYQFLLKRAMDVALASVGLLFSAPIALLTAVAIKLTSRGPILFEQKRVGHEGRIFTLYKFRSMRADAEKDSGPVWARADDDRVTPVGRVIRKLRIDEIPQMWNVLRGEMSFVGPRPERPFFVEELKKEIPYYTERLVVKPGITGWAQINYRYGASKEDAVEKLQYDLYYIKNMSIFLDTYILLRTVKVVLLGFGAR